ncbi:hypothetical protein [Winogradskyella sp. SYSU M77433]|uniref:hypothetical protein n=1 Tax=Winogradskyella sp. SYSU M77433 TaxID=3042722 RepID=UPI002481884F|nr:hypothetical protein [Winogradskyella sp. SYSU M77433]MDH7911511.1 hypothetical protein [Winogradskyella sp. SYSU M77433]
MSQDIIIIAGMHRSGTSLSGNLLQQSGLFIGEDLLSHGFDNKKGHFEDLEILKIHETDLKEKGLDTRGIKGDIKGNLDFEKSTENKINSFLKKRSNQTFWGWKEPRTTLYLQAWKEKLPNVKCIAIFRHYDEVENSLIRRYKHKLKKGVGMSKIIRLKHLLFYPLLLILKKREAYRAWSVYNNNILDFKKRYPDDVVIFELDFFLENYNLITENLNSRFNINLKTIDVNSVFEKSLLKKSKTKKLKIRFFSRKNLKKILEVLKQESLWM